MAANRDIGLAEQVRMLQGGSKEAFAAIYDQYSAALFGVASRIVGSDDVAEDVLQDTFMKIWKHAKSYKAEKGSFFTWMLNIARNTAIDRLRKQEKEAPLEIQGKGSNVGISQKDSEMPSLNHIGLKELVDKLPNEQRQLIDYVFFRGYTHQEASDELGLPLGTVKTRIRTAIGQLRRVFTSLLFWI